MKNKIVAERNEPDEMLILNKDDQLIISLDYEEKLKRLATQYGFKKIEIKYSLFWGYNFIFDEGKFKKQVNLRFLNNSLLLPKINDLYTRLYKKMPTNFSPKWLYLEAVN